MTFVVIYLATFLASMAAAVQQTEYCGHDYDARFTLLPMNDVMFTQDLLSEVSSSSEIDCGRECVGAEGCVMFTFQCSMEVALGRCRVYGKVHNLTDDKEDSTGARSYILEKEVLCRLYNGYSLKCGRCIRVMAKESSYQLATQACQQLDGGHLFFAKTAADLQFGLILTQEYDIKRLWIGADDLEKEGEFKWADGSLLSSKSPLWQPGQPDKMRQDCVCLWRTDGKLHDCDCNIPAKALTVCQKDI